jgi:hypothetical protein
LAGLLSAGDSVCRFDCEEEFEALINERANFLAAGSTPAEGTNS